MQALEEGICLATRGETHIVPIKDCRKTSVLGEVFSNLGPLRLSPSENGSV